MSWNWFDLLLFVLFAVFVAQGLWRGFSRLAIGLAATVLGILLAAWFYGLAAAWFLPWVKNTAVANVCGFLTILLAVQALGALLAFAVSRFFKAAGLGWLDRLLGAAFGAAKAALVGIALSLILTAFPISSALPDSLSSSRLAPYLSHASALLALATPHEIKSGFERTHKALRELWNRQPPAPSIETNTF